MYSHAAVEIHSVDTDRWVVFDTKINMFADTEAKVPGLGKVFSLQLVLLDFETTLKNLLGFRSADSDVDGNLFVTADTKCADSVSSLA